jgi:hypothetical protein
MMSAVLPFSVQPSGFKWLDNEPTFDPALHLQLEQPKHVRMLAEFGYTDAEIAVTATPVAATSAFRVLSPEGAAVMLDVARRLEASAQANPRIERAVRSGCHRSRWLRDLCIAPEITEHLCEIYGVDVAPHPITSQLGHLNYAPSEIGTAVDKWHHDTLAIDYVMMVADPTVLDGGDFEYFVGTKAEVAALADRAERPPADRCISVEWPGAGFAVALHGNMVVHRGGPLHQPGERISMVNGYIATDVTVDDQTRNVDLFHVDEPATLTREWARYAAWRSQRRLELLINDLNDSSTDVIDAGGVVERLAEATHDVGAAITDLQRTDRPAIHHYETEPGNTSS